MDQNNNSNNSTMTAILVILVVIIVGFIVWYVMDRRAPAPVNTNNGTSPALQLNVGQTEPNTTNTTTP